MLFSCLRLRQSLNKVRAPSLITLLVVGVLLSFSAYNPVPLYAQTPSADWWVDGWILVYSDADQSGIQDYRDVEYIWLKYNTTHLHLKVSTYDKPGWNGPNYRDARYSCYFDVNRLTDPATVVGNNIVNAEYKLFLEDSPKRTNVEDDGMGEIFLIKDLDGSGEFADWEITETNNYLTNPTSLWSGFRQSENTIGPTVPNAADNPQLSDTGDLDHVGFRIEGYYVYMYVTWESVGITVEQFNFDELGLFFSTDKEENNLNSAENLDSPETGFCIPYSDYPDIQIVKATNGFAADEPPGPYLYVGERVEWTYNITNTGKANLTNIIIVDDQGCNVTLPMTTLRPGEHVVGTAEGVAIAGQYKNTAIVTAEDPRGYLITATAASHYYGYEFALIIGTVFNDLDLDGINDDGEPGIPNVTVSLEDVDGNVQNVTTDSVGAYQFEVLPGTDIRIASKGLSHPWYPTTPEVLFARPPTAGVYADNDFGYSNTFNGVIYGIVFDDINGDGKQDFGELGIIDATVSLYREDGELLASIITTTNGLMGGTFTFAVNETGVYRVNEQNPPGWRSTTPDDINVLVSELGRSYYVAFGDTCNLDTASIYGIVFNDLDRDGDWDAFELGLSDVTISLYNSTDLVAIQTTGSYGDYTFAVNQLDLYSVIEIDLPDWGWYSTTPNEVHVAVELGQSYQVDFGDARDESAPVIVSVTNDPEPPLEHEEPTIVWVEAVDNVGVVRMTIEWPNSGLQEMVYDAASGLWTYTLPGQIAGTRFSVTVKAYDGIGNYEESSFEKWWTDQSAPVIVSVDASPDAPAVSENVTIIAHVTDNVAVDSVIISYDNVDYDMTLDAGNTQDGWWIHSMPGSGTETTLTYTITASDEAGNQATDGPHEVAWRLQGFTLTLWPTEGYGDTTVHGTGFAHNAIITLTWNDQQVTTTPITLVTDDTGEFTAIIHRHSREEILGPNIVKAVDEYGNVKSVIFTALEALQGETGLTGETGDDYPPGYLAGLLLLVGAISFLISLTITWKTRRDEEPKPAPRHLK